MKVAVLFHRLGPYHHARLRAAAGRMDLTAVEFSAVDHTYAWDQVKENSGFQRLTLFDDADVDTKTPAEVLQRMNAALTEIGPDVVAIPGWSSLGALIALSWSSRFGVPSIVMSDSTAHDQIRRVWIEAVKRRVIGLFSAGLVGGRANADYLASLGIPRERIVTGYDVIDNHHFACGADKSRHDADAMRTSLSLPRDFFLASNRFIEKKNLPGLLNAYARYRNQAGSSAWKLVILGDGPLKPKLQDLVNQYDLAGWVLMPGFKQYDDLPAYYGLAGAFIHASTSEQWGLVVNEAMAAGLPVLVSNRCGCAPDLVEEGRNGHTFDPYDVAALAELMLKVTSDDCDRAAMGQASRDIVSRWGLDRFAQGIEAAVEKAVVAGSLRCSPFNRLLLHLLIQRNDFLGFLPTIPKSAHPSRYVSASPFGKGGLTGIYLKKSPLTPLLQRGGLNNYPSKDVETNAVEKLFTDASAEYSKLFLPERRGKNFEFRRRRAIAVELSSAAGGSLLECAAGSGEITAAILKTGHFSRATVLDISPKMLECAQTRIKTEIGEKATVNLEFACADVFNFATDKSERRFDLIVCLCLIAHTGRLPELLTTLTHLLTEDGAILLQSTLLDHIGVRILRNLTAERFYRRHGYQHSFFWRKDIIKAAHQSGLSVADTRRYVSGFSIADRIWPWACYYLEMASQPFAEFFGAEAVFLLKKGRG